MKIGVHYAWIRNSGYRAFKITSTSKTNAHRLNYQYGTKVGGIAMFTLQANLDVLASSGFPEGGLGLTSRKINGHKYKVIRGYAMQGGYGDFIKGHKIAHSYYGY